MIKRYWESLKKIIYVFDAKQKRSAVMLIVAIIIGALFELLGVTAILPFVSLALSPNALYKEDNSYLLALYNKLGLQNTAYFLAVMAAILILIYIVKNVYLTFMSYSIYRFTYFNQRKLANRLLSCYLHQPYSFYLNNNSSVLIQNIGTDVVQFYEIVLCSMQLIVEIIVCGLLTVYLFITDKSISIGVVVILMMFFLLFFKVIKKKIRTQGEIVRKNRQGQTRWLMQSFGGIKETKIAQTESYFLKKFDKEYESFAKNHCSYQTLAYLPKPAMETVVIGALLFVVIIKLIRGVDSVYFVSTMSVFAVAAYRLLPSFNRISGYLSRIMFDKASVDAIYKDLKDVEKLETNMNDKDDDINIIFDKEITVEDLTFKYPLSEKNVLEDISLSIPKNKSVAFIGPSGAGKTTLADIILGILYQQKGSIKVDGTAIPENSKAWKRKLGYIPQSIFLIDDTIKHNIAYGVDDKDIDEKRVLEVIEESQLKSFIDTLPDGMNTEIGERGVRLSGGQRQRIGIARALYNDPEILVLDEATSALDTETETAVMEAIDSLSGKKTLIIIAHRLSTIENCDIRYEVKDGKVICQK